MSWRMQTTLVNEDTDMIFAEFEEEVPAEFIDEEAGTYCPGELFRALRSEWGACRSKVYVDTLDGGAKEVGWYFVKRQRYEDTGQRYLRGAWVRLVKLED